MSQIRQLAAIMFTDIVGYTVLMGEDEQKAFEILNKNRQLQKPLIEKYGGNWVKELGDGVLATFSTVTDAVRCGCEIINASEEVDELQLRIGIHQAEVLFENGDVFGDGVNIAARIQAIAPINGIYITETVYNNIANKAGFHSSFVKEETLKHVKEPIRLYTVIAEHKVKNSLSNSSLLINKRAIQEKVLVKSIAVLPFVNMSNDPEQEYFSDGIAEEILISLSNLNDLKVAGRTSSFQFKGKNLDLRKVGEQLGVTNVLEGSVRKQGNRIRITAQLINVEDGFHLWSEKYDREINDIFAIQDEIALAITEKLKITLLEAQRDSISKTPTENTEAYQLYLKGRFFWNKRGIYLEKGLHFFMQAAEIDDDYALAHAGIADSYALLSFYCIIAPHNAMPKAKMAAERALELNPTLVEAHTSLGFVYAFYDWNWPKAKEHFIRSISINHNYATAHYWYSFYLAMVENKIEEAKQEGFIAIELEPLSWVPYNLLAVAHVLGGEFEEAIKICEKGIELNPNAFFLVRHLGVSYLALQKYPEAIKALITATQISSKNQWPLLDLCIAYVEAGNIPKAQEIYDELVKRSHTEYISGLFLFVCAYSLNKIDEAYQFLQKAFEQRDGNLLSARQWPSMSLVRNDPFFIDIMNRINFPSN